MMRQTYYEFINSFGELNPYELDHLCEVMYRKLTQVAKETSTDPSAKLPFNEQDLKHVFIKTMIEIRIMLAEYRKEEAEQQLKLAKSVGLTKKSDFKPDS